MLPFKLADDESLERGDIVVVEDAIEDTDDMADEGEVEEEDDDK